MKKKSIAIKLLCLSILSLVVFSCIPLSKVKYLQDKEGVVPVNTFQNIRSDYRVKPGDFLYIRLMTLDEKSNEIFASITGSTNQNGMVAVSEQSLYISSYLVNDSGYVVFPLLGNIPAAGHTVTEIEASLNKAASDIIKESSVVVKLVLYNISILGEVRNPGKFPIYNNHVNIFEALSMANDMTSFANRNNVKIIRSDGNKNTVVTLDLTSKDILSSPYFYLQPNDIVYVEPLKNKTYVFEAFPYALILSTITTTLVIAQFFKL